MPAFNLGWQMQKFSRVVICAALITAASGVAQTPGERSMAEKTNAAYQTYEGSGLSPVIASEMASCHAMWQRWQFVVDSSSVPEFTRALLPDLSSQHAKRKAGYWLKKSKASARAEKYDKDEIVAMMAEAQEAADEEYAWWINNDPDKQFSLPRNLGTCR